MLIIHAMIFSDEHLAENECSFCLFPKELDMIPLQKKKKKLQGIVQLEPCLF